jgi:N-acetyl sugar amidotransferase
MPEFRICTRSILDTTVPGITFDENGVSHYCKIYDEMAKLYPEGEKAKEQLAEVIKKIKEKGRGKKYDCIIGVSGGTDSSYTMLKVIEAGLRPLAVHLDNGWNSDIAVKNIKKACSILGIDLYTYVIDWEEFKDLQISFLKASTPDAEIPTDVAIHATLVKIAAKEGVKFVLNGHSFRTEFIMPKGWTYMDGKYIKSVQKMFGKKKLKSFPNFTVTDVLYYNFIKGIKVIPFLNYYDYTKEEAKKILIEKLDWQYYGGHHHENTYTKFYQSYLLPVKFGIDKRKTALSASVLSGKMTREEALNAIEADKHFVDQETIDYVISKLGLTQAEFDAIMKLPVKSFQDYPTYHPLMKMFKLPILIACKMGILPMLLYYKFLDE